MNQTLSSDHTPTPALDAANPYRTHACGDLRPAQVGARVRVAGWVHARRDHGGVYFFDLRDRSGLIQVVANPEQSAAFLAASKLGSEHVVSVLGALRPRPQGTENPKIPTGGVEIAAEEITLLNTAKTLPFEVDSASGVSEETRLKYRFLDLRSERMRENLRLRHRVGAIVRRELDALGFWEVETPILTKATPEGARDFLVPCRLRPGTFYALPQSPQIFKQILMASGVEKYYQLARAFRDEDLRADRQPEHTQIDLEMSFIEEKDVHAVVERFLKAVFKEAMGTDLETPFARVEYEDLMRRYGSDKADLRYGFEIFDLTDLFKGSAFKVFGEAARSGGVVRAIAVSHEFSRADIDKLTEMVKGLGLKGLAWIKWTAAGPESPIVKFLKPEELSGIEKAANAKPGTVVFFAADKAAVAAPALGALRKELIAKIKPEPIKPWSFYWVLHFPLLEWEPEEKRWTFTHNPFTAPLAEDMPKLDSDPGNIRSHQYDLVLNSTELASGSVRNHRADIQRKILSLMGYSPAEQEEKFGLLLNALEHGAPPHGGIALGFDRLIAILRGEDSIREVIAFPKTQKGTCPLSEAPGPVGQKQLKELHIKLDLPPQPAKPA
ncbi:MAG TPA: aspartate--tRNA ligase [Elusimicrobiota bacterium]|nr:aspartate--tRNA ligase [Elusimicrobiota bacterium]